MIPVHEAQKKLIQAGYTVDMQSPYHELTILNAKYDDVKRFLNEQGYEGRIVVIGERRENTSSRLKTRQNRTEGVEGIEMYPKAARMRNRARDTDKNKEIETSYEQLSFLF